MYNPVIQCTISFHMYLYMYSFPFAAINNVKIKNKYFEFLSYKDLKERLI